MKTSLRAKHSVRLRVFDTSGNMAEREIEFNVSDDIAPRIFEVFTDANPASTAANFYVRHDRTDNLVEVGIEVFDLMGHLIWSAGQKGHERQRPLHTRHLGSVRQHRSPCRPRHISVPRHHQHRQLKVHNSFATHCSHQLSFSAISL